MKEKEREREKKKRDKRGEKNEGSIITQST